MYDGKYGKVTLENKPNLPDDEPCFVLRGQDILASGLVKQYAHIYFQKTGNATARDAILAQADKMRAWTTHKIPD